MYSIWKIVEVPIEIVMGVSVVSAGLGYLIAKWTQKKEEYNEVLFFPDGTVSTFQTRQFTNSFTTGSNMEIDGGSSLAKLLSHLRDATVSVDVCVMIFTCHEFAR
eukprot:TRINITY_DN13395_c0_g1_i2.p1 TRINITY_DN13395_c0_g1~~TRINITY_DN13395_c0_g1_i2.p1  ORF type:complete len:105 (-),score=10.50 TRINITY_DN13395_c0_g1_i2:561-875(-)